MRAAHAVAIVTLHAFAARESHAPMPKPVLSVRYFPTDARRIAESVREVARPFELSISRVDSQQLAASTTVRQLNLIFGARELVDVGNRGDLAFAIGDQLASHRVGDQVHAAASSSPGKPAPAPNE